MRHLVGARENLSVKVLRKIQVQTCVRSFACHQVEIRILLAKWGHFGWSAQFQIQMVFEGLSSGFMGKELKLGGFGVLLDLRRSLLCLISPKCEFTSQHKAAVAA